MRQGRSEPTGETILIVDDNKDGRQLVKTVLMPHGYELLFAKDGPEAIEIAVETHPDLVLMDLNLPLMSGREVTETLKSRLETTDIPIVALTAHAVGSERQRALEAGCAGYITKPIDTRSFADQLQRYLL